MRPEVEPLLAKLEERAREGSPLWNERADPDVPGEAQVRPRPHGRRARAARELEEALGEGVLAALECARVAADAERPLAEVRAEVPDVERGVAGAIQVEVDDSDPPGRYAAVVPVRLGSGSRSNLRREGSDFSGKSSMVPRSQAFHPGGTRLLSFEPLYITQRRAGSLRWRK